MFKKWNGTTVNIYYVFATPTLVFIGCKAGNLAAPQLSKTGGCPGGLAFGAR